MTKYEKVIMGKTIAGTVHDALASQIESLFAIIEKVNRDQLVHGFTLQAGWAIYQLRERAIGCFILTTPDCTRNPFQDMTEDLTLPLYVQLEQSCLLKKLNIEGEETKFSDKVVLSKGVLDSKETYLERNGKVEEGDSGWYAGFANDQPAGELYAVHAYQLLEARPEFIQVLALPRNYLVVFEGDEIKAILNEEDEDVFR